MRGSPIDTPSAGAILAPAASAPAVSAAAEAPAMRPLTISLQRRQHSAETPSCCPVVESSLAAIPAGAEGGRRRGDPLGGHDASRPTVAAAGAERAVPARLAIAARTDRFTSVT